MRTNIFILLAAAMGVCLCLPSWGHCLTPEEIAYLKQQGVSDETIQVMLTHEHEARKQEDTSIQFKKTGTAKTYTTGKPSGTPLSEQQQQDADRAWRMLENMFIDVNMRRRGRPQGSGQKPDGPKGVQP